MSTTGIENFKWETDGEGVTITAYTGDKSYVVIPETIDEKPVTRIEENTFCGCKGLISVLLPNSVMIIGERPLDKCNNLMSVFYQEDFVSYADENEFPPVRKLSQSELESLKQLSSYYYEFPIGDRNNWEEANGQIRVYSSVGEDLFSRCFHTIVTDEDGVDHLVRIEFRDFDGRPTVFSGDQVLGLHKNCPVRWENGLLIDWQEKSVLCWNSKETDIVVPDGIENLGFVALYDTTRSLSIPASVTWFAFQQCPNLEIIRLASSLKKNRDLVETLKYAYPQARICFFDEFGYDEFGDPKLVTINLTARLKQARGIKDELRDSYPQAEIQ